MSAEQHASPDTHYGHEAADLASRDTSSPSSPPMGPPGTRPRKRVDWQLPRDDDAPDDPRPLDLHIQRQGEGSQAANQLSDQEREAELRRDIHRIFNDHAPPPPPPPPPQESPKPPPTPSVPRINTPAAAGPPASRPKPVLRSGTATPIRAPSPPLDGIVNLEGKARSADVARAKADRLSKTLDDNDSSHSARGVISRWLHSGRHKRDSSAGDGAAALPLFHDGGEPIHSGQVTPDAGDDLDYVPKPSRYRALGLSAHLLLSGISPGGSRRNSFDDSTGSNTPGSATPPASPPPGSRARYRDSPRHSFSSMSKFLNVPAGGSSRPGSADGAASSSADGLDQPRPKRPSFGRFPSDGNIDFGSGYHQRHGSSVSLLDNFSKFAHIKSAPKTPSQRQRARKQVDITIKKHIQETRMRQRYLLKLCRALMEYGAPTHRLEDYMKMSARVLETEAQFLYMPGCMIVSFDDTRTHTTEVKIVRVYQGTDLGKLRDTHNVYKDVVHDNIGVEEATQRITDIMLKPKKYRVWWLVLMYGLASATVAPFAFGAQLIDLPIAFFLGLFVGFLRLVWAAKSDLYAAIFEVLSVILTSFISRAFGSISRPNGEYLFCFPALAQSSIALILPGYILLCGALELQSHSILAGSVRVFYAVIYSLFIGFGLTIGIVVYGVLDKHASTAANCSSPVPRQWNFLFVFFYSFTLMFINQAKLKQMPIMAVIAMIGYVVSYFSGQRFDNAAVTSGLAAVAVAASANAYSRLSNRFSAKLEALTSKSDAMGSKMHLLARKHLTGVSSASEDTQPEAGQKTGAKAKTRWWKSLPVKKQPKLQREPDYVQMQTMRQQDEQRDLEKQEPAAGEGSRPDTPGGGGEEAMASTTTLDGNASTTTLAENDEGGSLGHAPPPPTQQGQEQQQTSETKPEKKVNYSLAAAAMLPAIMVLVPSGLSVSGSLVQGITEAQQLVSAANSSASATASTAATTTAAAGGTATSVSSISTSAFSTNSTFSVSISVIQIAIGLTVGLFVGTLVVYPFGKGGKGSSSRSGIFSF